MRIDWKKFESVCLEIISEPDYDREKYLHIVKDNIPTHYLKPSLQNRAKKHFPYSQVGYRVSFPADIVRKIAEKMNLYVTDIVIYK